MTTPTAREHELAARAENNHLRQARFGALYEEPVGQTVVDALAAYREELLAEVLGLLLDHWADPLEPGAFMQALGSKLHGATPIASNTAEAQDEKETP